MSAHAFVFQSQVGVMPLVAFGSRADVSEWAEHAREHGAVHPAAAEAAEAGKPREAKPALRWFACKILASGAEVPNA